MGRGTEIVSIEFIEAGSPQSEFFGGNGGGQFFAPQGRQHLADQRRAETMGKLAIMFFINAQNGISPRSYRTDSSSPAGLPSAFATLKPPPGPQGWKCSPLLAHLSGFERTLFAFARRATGASFLLPVPSYCPLARRWRGAGRGRIQGGSMRTR